MGERKKSEVNLLDLVPARLIEFEVDDARIVTVLAPRFRSRIWRRLFESRLKRPYLKVKLDDVGSEVWMLCDGKRNVKQIADVLQEKFKERIEPCYDRLGQFFRQLEHARFIRYANLDECLEESTRGAPRPPS